MKLGDRFWLWRNKKTPTKHARYGAMAFCWICVGIMLTIASQNAILLIANIRAKSEYVGDWAVLFGVTLGLFVIMCLVIYFADRKQGYVDAVHSHHLDRWQKRRMKIFGKK
jgi:hypothetical protein